MKRDPGAMMIGLGLVSKLASIVVHADELLSPLGHGFDQTALEQAVHDPEVQEWIKALGPLAPVKRVKLTKSDAMERSQGDQK